MKGTLVKRSNDRFDLYSIEDKNQINTIASSFDNPIGKLSLKNCQAIELGYDLDELAEEWVFETNGHKWSNNDNTAGDNYGSFKAGFQKTLEILGDKKYILSEEDLHRVIDMARLQGEESFLVKHSNEEIIQSLQQTEWGVEVGMICPHPEDTYVCGIQYGCDEDGCNHPNKIPLLDKDDCLILKRI